MEDWDRAFMEAATNSTRRTSEEIREELTERAKGRMDRAVYLRGADGERIGEDRLFQIRINSCSREGLKLYLQDYPELAETLESLPSGGDLVSPG